MPSHNPTAPTVLHTADETRTDGLLTPFLRRRRLAMVRPHLQGSVLDIGCGIGFLAGLVDPDRYLGFDIYAPAVEEARRRCPNHRFVTELSEDRRFDTVVALAVIEHLEDPVETLRHWAARLTDRGRLVMTTPHPAGQHVYDIGARLGAFSRHASDDHEALIGRGTMAALAREVGLTVTVDRRFLLGMNQLFVLEPGRR